MITRFIKAGWIFMMLAVLFVVPVYANEPDASKGARGKHLLEKPSEPATPEMLREVDEINQNIRNKGAKWKASVTPMTRLSPEERKRFGSGLVLSPEDWKRLKHLHPELSLPGVDEYSQLFTSSSSTSSFSSALTGTVSSVSANQVVLSELTTTITLPSRLDYRNYNGGNYVTGVRGQDCNNCWAFASTAALESRVLLDLNMPGVDLDLSERINTTCSGSGSCAGGWAVTDFFVNTGLPPESFFPGGAWWQNCSDATPGWQLATYKVTGYQAFDFTSVDELKTALYLYGPMYVGMVAWNEFFSYGGGVYSWSGTPQPYSLHAVELVGYDDESSSFIAKNSWGPFWGEAGFFRISYYNNAPYHPFAGFPIIAYTGAYQAGLGSAISTPYSGAAVKGNSLTITGGAMHNPGSAVQDVSVSMDGGAYWSRAMDTSGDGSWRTWSYYWSLPADGIYTLVSRAVGTDGAVENPRPGISVTVDNTSPWIGSVEAVIGIDASGPYLGPLDGAIVDGRGLWIYSEHIGDNLGTGGSIRTVEFSTDGGAWNTAKSPYGNVWGGMFYFSWISTEAGPHQIKIRVIDRAENITEYIANVTVAWPTSSITSPANGAYIQGPSVQITGTAVDNFGSGVQKVEVSTDGGATWQLATGTTNWSYTWTYPMVTGGVYQIKSRATDNTGKIEPIGAGITVYGLNSLNISWSCPGGVVQGEVIIGTLYNCAVTASGGAAPFTWSTSSLPDWLSFTISDTSNSSTLTLSGIAPAGWYYFSLFVTDQNGLSAAYYGQIWGHYSPNIRTTSLPQGVVGVPYGSTGVYIEAQGPDGCCTGWWEGCGFICPAVIFSSSTLPAGMSLNPNTGLLSGTPAEVGTFDVTFEFRDGRNGLTASKTLQLVITDIIVDGLRSGSLNKPYNDTVRAVDNAPFTWSATSLPPGITIDSSIGILSGTPTAAGIYLVSIQATDASQETRSKLLELSISDVADEWVQSMTGDGGSAERVAMDAQGNIYTLANFTNLSGSRNRDVILRKYSSAGTEAWSLVIDYDDEFATDMVLDGGTAYLLINVYNAATGSYDPHIFKVNDSGTIIGNVVLTNIHKHGNRFARDINGNYYVATMVSNGVNNDAKIFKYTDTGEPLWVATYDSGDWDFVFSMAIDAAGNSYAAGMSGGGGGNSGSTVIKFDPSGNHLWTTVFPGTSGHSKNYGIAVDDIGNVYVTGSDYENQDWSLQTQKYDASGTLVWTRPYDRTGKYDQGEDIILDGRGSIYVVGSSEYSTVGNRDYLILKYDTAGNILWSKNFNTLGADNDYAYSIAVDQNDTLVIAGNKWSPILGTSEVSTVKLYRTDLAITTASLPRGTTGAPYSHQLVGEHGLPPYNWTASNLPAGLVINSTTGIISGTSTTAGSTSVTIQLSDTSGISVSKDLTLDIYAPLVITTSSLPGGMIGTLYDQTLMATGGKPSFTWSIPLGTLPQGLSLNAATGTIIGNPTTAGTSTFTVQVTDANATTKEEVFTITITCTVTATAGANGTITPSGAIISHGGERLAFTVTPNADYHTALVSGCSGTLNGSTYTTGPVTADCAVSATFAINTYIVTPAAGPNGSLSPSVPQTVNYLQSAVFSVATYTGFHIGSVTGCGGTLNGSTYTTGPITADCTVSATFAINTYTVTPAAGPNGAISPSTPQTVNHLQSAVFSVATYTGYHIASVTGCSGTLNGSAYTTGPVTADCTVSATFAINTYALTVTKAGTGTGTVTSSPAGISCGSSCSATYNHGTVVTLTAASSADSLFAGWSGGGCSGTGTCVTTMDAAKTVTATFNQYITVTVPNGGESWTRGTTYTIRWNYAGNPGTNVKIELLKGGVLNRTITSSTSRGSGGSGSYNWRVPSNQATGSDYTIRVTSTSNSNYRDTSNANFAIQ